MPPHVALTVLCITAAVLLIGGAILIRLQRDRQHFRLMQLALERGITAFPGVPPGWLISLRIGCLIAVLGVGLMFSGGVVWFAAPNLETLPEAIPATTASAIPRSAAPAQTPPATAQQDERPLGPENPPPEPDPQMERWHRIESEKIAGLVGVCAGAILTALGVVRMLFARMERMYTQGVIASPRGSAP